MVWKKPITDIFRVLLGNGATVLSGVFLALVLPGVLSVDSYGWYKTFTLYLTYTAFCSLGITDGIVLLIGGKDYEMLDGAHHRGLFRSFFLMVCGFAILGSWMARYFPGEELGFVMGMVCLDLIAVNGCNYFRNISQATRRFGEFARRTAIQSGLKVLATGIAVLLHRMGKQADHHLWLWLWVGVDYLLLIWYLATYRNIVFGRAQAWASVKQDLFWMIRQGFPILCANLVTTLILTVDRQFVSLLYPLESYALYAFAYNLLTLVTVAVSAISTVVYPQLSRIEPDQLGPLYGRLKQWLSLLVFGLLAGFFPLAFLVERFLPRYSGALDYVRLLFPGTAISAVLSAVMHNYYKVLTRGMAFFCQSGAVLLLAVGLNLLAVWLFGTMTAISGASVLTLLLWYAIADLPLKKRFALRRSYDLGYLLVMMAVFYTTTACSRGWKGCLLYFLLYGLVSVLFLMGQKGKKVKG